MMVAELVRPAHVGVTVAAMRRRHLRQVLAIERQVYPRPWALPVFAAELAAQGRCYLVAVASAGLRRTVMGYAGLLVSGGEAHITTVAVDPRHHRRKIATRLLIELLVHARAMDAHAASLEVRASNHGAQRLYSAFGFAPVGVAGGYYSETGEDAVVMWAGELQSATTAERLRVQMTRVRAPGGASGAPDLPVPWVQGRVGLSGAVEPRFAPSARPVAPIPKVR